MNYVEAKLELDRYAKSLDLHAFIINKKAENKKLRIIVVKHFDGSYLEFHSAAFKRLDKEWMAVFTEHHGNFLYHFEDVRLISEMGGKELYRYKE